MNPYTVLEKLIDHLNGRQKWLRIIAVMYGQNEAVEHILLTQYDLLVTRHFHKINNNIFILNNVFVCPITMNLGIIYAVEPNCDHFFYISISLTMSLVDKVYLCILCNCDVGNLTSLLNYLI